MVWAKVLKECIGGRSETMGWGTGIVKRLGFKQGLKETGSYG